MKLYLALLITLPLLATALKIKTQTRETYASYAKRNGIPLEKSKAEQQSATCYDYFGQQGSSLIIYDYVPDLLQLGGWDNLFSSCCFYGTWVLYDDYQYNGNNPNVRQKFLIGRYKKHHCLHFQAAAYSSWGENYCTDLQGSPSFDNKASSVRFVGAPDGYKYDTINLYEYDFYMGLEQYAYGDAPTLNYDNLGR